MRQSTVKNGVTGINKIYFLCDHCGHPHPNIPNSGICRRCHRKSQIQEAACQINTCQSAVSPP